jgi:Kef-type K+ transport system membrane component KefB
MAALCDGRACANARAVVASATRKRRREYSSAMCCAMLARFVLHWTWPASWLAGVALSTTSVAVVYAVMLELGLNRTDYGKSILAACFVNDLGTVIALGLIFSPFTSKTVMFASTSIVVFAALPFVTPWFFRRYGGRVSELEAKFILLMLFAMGGLAVWAGSEAVLPAYLIGMVLAGTVGNDHVLVRRLRTVTFGLLTPFYFIRAGSFVSVPALVTAPMTFVLLFLGKSASKSLGIWPTVRWYKYEGREGMYYTLMMSTGLTFGTISALFGLNHHVIDQAQYSYLVATVIGSAVIPTMIANSFFMPTHLLPRETPAPALTPGSVGVGTQKG